MRQSASRGMVQVRGVTYRVERMAAHHYAVIRLIDDVGVGSFRTLPGLRLEPRDCEVELFAEIARTALRFARTSGVLPAVAMPAPEQQQAPPPRRSSPSSMPPGPLPV
jgi:hypothetical protein